MKYTLSNDGVERTSVRVVMRLSKDQVKELQALLKAEGNGRTIKSFADDALLRGWQGELEAMQEMIELP